LLLAAEVRLVLVAVALVVEAVVALVAI